MRLFFNIFMFSKYFFFKDEFLIFHLMNSNIDYIRKFIDSKKNKDKARRFIIQLKYQLSKSSPLVYETIRDSADKFYNNTHEESGGWTRVKGQEDGIFLYNHVSFNLEQYKIFMTMQGYKLIFLYKSRSSGYSAEMIPLGLSRLEKRLMYFLSWYKIDNKSKIETFKNNTEYDKIINRR